MRLDKELDRIRKAYDLTVEQHGRGIDPFDTLPEDFKNSSDFIAFRKEMEAKKCSSSDPEIEEYLKPASGMRFLDVGCCANLANYRLDRWPSTYYGIDISPALIRAMEKFVSRENISIGGLWVADVANLPFDDNFFDIVSMIGVLEYCTIEYCKRALQELHRVMKGQAKMVLDIPNLEHPYVSVMFQLEEYLERPNIPKSRSTFKRILTPLYTIERADDSQVMLKYFIRSTKMRVN
ncbi:MAG: class I SAM-dependent methyltransferase [bacterium]